MDSGLFDYILPKEMIAQHPAEDRSSSRLLVFNRNGGTTEHCSFRDITRYFHKGDVLVLNDSRVFPARLRAIKDSGGSIDILLVEKIGEKRWHCLANGIKKGVAEIIVSVGNAKAKLTRHPDFWMIEFSCPGDEFDIIRQYGQMPLPPYIKRKEKNSIDFERYQTVYAREEGSIAAPTAGFHFTKELIENIENIGVNIVKITLHIGIGTFYLIKKQCVEEHKMYREYYQITRDVKEYIQYAKNEGRRIIACGTSVVRTLETAYSANGSTPLNAYTELFIYPGYKFKMVDALITNFHLPKSTPLLLASAFAGRDGLLKCYMEAMERDYRFYSYGDSMFIT
ncbi:MAG: tRNA preQ1(34) S-adenosylmethionine ribosyltransferase-isomerase QueA [Proteobacteria bacterium]|nr:tRNA preQ1(34) S-adenosylmethionine ribosyltransferase-isomerase QueA [Pseudomonadota bacterium]